MSIVREIPEGAVMPAWYGVAYVRLDRMIAVAWPIPLNVLVSWLRTVWTILRRFGVAHDPLMTAYQRGFDEGLHRAREYHFNEGYIAGGKAVGDEIRRSIREALK